MHKCDDYRCKYRVMKFIGACKDCEKIYCHLHRYPEAHFCPKLRERQAFELKNLSTRLLNESTKEVKINKM